jgi:hypothetical protein
MSNELTELHGIKVGDWVGIRSTDTIGHFQNSICQVENIYDPSDYPFYVVNPHTNNKLSVNIQEIIKP